MIIIAAINESTVSQWKEYDIEKLTQKTPHAKKVFVRIAKSKTEN